MLTYILCFLLLGSVLISEAGATTSPSPTLCDNGLGMLSMAQLIDSKVKIDPVVPEKFHKDLQPSYAVSHTSERVQQVLLHDIYRSIPNGLKLIERDAFTFQHLSENGMKTFYPEAYEIRTRDIKKSESHKTDL